MKYSETKQSDINVAMAGVLRGERKRAMLSMEDMCRLTGITESTLKRILNGSSDISVADLALIATALNRARPERSRRTPSWLLNQAEHDIGRWDFSLSDEADSPDGGLFNDVVEEFDREVREHGDGFENTAAYAEFRAQHFGHRAPVRKAATSDPELDTDEPGTP